MASINFGCVQLGPHAPLNAQAKSCQDHQKQFNL
jgi:hypothetical protein